MTKIIVSLALIVDLPVLTQLGAMEAPQAIKAAQSSKPQQNGKTYTGEDFVSYPPDNNQTSHGCCLSSIVKSNSSY